MPSYPELKGWPKGVNNLLDHERLPRDALAHSVNFDLDDSGKLRRRRGATKVYAGAITKGTFFGDGTTALFVEQGTLKRLNPDWSATVLREGVGDTPMAVCAAPDGVLYYSNGAVTGRLVGGEAAPWGVRPPPRQPRLEAHLGGRLAPGLYQVAVVFVRRDGEESGTGLAAAASVSADGRLLVTDLPQPEEPDTLIRLYVSAPGGTVLYRLMTLPAGVPEVTLSTLDHLGTVTLSTQFATPPPPATLIEYHNGRLYLARGPVVWFTDPLRYGHIRPAENFFAFGAEVTLLGGVSDGLYVAADQTYFIAGLDTPALVNRAVRPYGAVRGTLVRWPNSSQIAWWSPKGLMVAGAAGQVSDGIADRVAVSPFERGTALYREHRGLKQVLVCLQRGRASSAPSADWSADEIARRGDAL